MSQADSAYFVYDDALHWDNWSWNTRVDPNESRPVFSGRRSMEVEFHRRWAALSLHTNSFNTSPYSALAFAIHPDRQSLSSIEAALYNSSGRSIKGVNIASYASPAGDDWHQVSIPLATLEGANTTITRVQLQHVSGRTGQDFHIDDLQFVGGAAPDPTPTPAPTPTPQPTPTPTPDPTPMPTPSPTPTPMPTPTPPPPPPPVQPLVPQPGPRNQVVPFFQQPFAGDFPLHNTFDHDLPFHSRDTNGFMLTWWGSKTVGQWGGDGPAKLDGHDGWDWLMPEGTPILAAAEGTVIRAANGPAFWCAGLQRVVDDSLAVEIWHVAPNGARYVTNYSHISRADVKEGDWVEAGQHIALSGNRGCSTTPHLHFHVFHKNSETGDWIKVDPYGWEADGPDPWAQHPEGASSVWLWKANSVPVLYREERQALNPNSGDNSPVAITLVRWMGWKDSDHPNNEFVQVELDPRFAPSGTYDLTGARLVNNQGSAFVFPDGFVVRNGAPVRVFTGPGTNSGNTLFWGRSAGMWDDMGDCAKLILSGGQVVSKLPFGGEPCSGG